MSAEKVHYLDVVVYMHCEMKFIDRIESVFPSLYCFQRDAQKVCLEVKDSELSEVENFLCSESSVFIYDTILTVPPRPAN